MLEKLIVQPVPFLRTMLPRMFVRPLRPCVQTHEEVDDSSTQPSQ